LQIGIENKIYSPENCVFLPPKVNSFLANKKSNNTSGNTGIYWNTLFKRWTSTIRDFNNDKYIRKHFEDKNEAIKFYEDCRRINSEKVKSYLESLNYLPKNIIELIK
jgi:hypothetical protein